MGGRGRDFLGGGGNNGGKTDNSQIVFAGRNVAITENAMKVLGEENAKDAIEYIANSMQFLTGREQFTALSIDDSASGNAYAHMRLFTGQMGINPKMYKNIKDVSELYESDVKSGWHPKGTGVTDVFVHESAHRIDVLLAQNNKMSTMASTKIVPEAIKAVQKAQKARGEKVQTSAEIQNSMSRYGGSYYSSHTGDKYVETFAEALADYNKNKGNAHPLSREIYRIMRDYL